MYLLTKSETVASGVTVIFTGGSDTGNIIDADLETFSETAQRAPNLTVDLGSRKAIDCAVSEGRKSSRLRPESVEQQYFVYRHRDGCHGSIHTATVS